MDPAQTALAAIGQSDVQVTPLQMAMIAAAVANNGQLMKPYLIDSVVNADLEVQTNTKPELLATPITPEVASQLRTMMVAVVDTRYGAGGTMYLPGRTVAAKTGTAEVADRNIAWSVAFIANDNPVVVAVAIQGDDINPYVGGGTDAGPVVRQLLEVESANE